MASLVLRASGTGSAGGGPFAGPCAQNSRTSLEGLDVGCKAVPGAHGVIL